MSKVVRTVRFTEEEARRIDQFLKSNPVFDFSKLTRLALDQFLESPKIELKPARRRVRVRSTPEATA